MQADELRRAVAAEYNISLLRQYREREAAAFWNVDVSTAKRWRREGLVPFIEMPHGTIKYFGFQIVDVLILGKHAIAGGVTCPSTPVAASSVESGTCASEATHPPGTEPDTTQERGERSASASAHLTKVLRKSG
jgi:hypothetical protein